MTEKIYTKDELMDATGDLVDQGLNQSAIVGDRDDGLDVYFEYRLPNQDIIDETKGFRIVEPNTIKKIEGYTFGSKADLYDDPTYIALPQEKKDAIPDMFALFFLTGTLKTGEVVHTHWQLEQGNFAQRVACDYWDSAESQILEDWGIEYDDVEEN